MNPYMMGYGMHGMMPMGMHGMYGAYGQMASAASAANAAGGFGRAATNIKKEGGATQTTRYKPYWSLHKTILKGESLSFSFGACSSGRVNASLRYVSLLASWRQQQR